MEQFTNKELGLQLRVVRREEEVWFVGKDVATALGYKEPSVAINKIVDEEDKGVSKMETPGGKQNVIIINESGLYSLVLRSKLETAKKFKRWITKEVLPSIRRTGSYSVPQTLEQKTAQALLMCQEILKEQQQLIAKQHQQLLDQDDELEDLHQVAKQDYVYITVIAQQVPCSVKKINKYLQELGYLHRGSKDWLPNNKLNNLGVYVETTTTVNPRTHRRFTYQVIKYSDKAAKRIIEDLRDYLEIKALD